MLLIAFCWLFLTSNSFLVNKAFQQWEFTPININSLSKTYEVGIVLSGGLINTPSPKIDHPTLGMHADRFSKAFLLYKAGKIKKILITGASPMGLMLAKKGETQQAVELLLDWGVKSEDIIFEEKARNTHENATKSAIILNKNFPGKNYLLITSSFHMRRALGCFNKEKIKTDPFPADFYGGNVPLNLKNLLVPDPDALANFELLWREWVGYVMYKLAGYC